MMTRMLVRLRRWAEAALPSLQEPRFLLLPCGDVAARWSMERERG